MGRGRWAQLAPRLGHVVHGLRDPAGIASRVARPDGEVIVFIGDDTFLVQPSEFVTSLQEDLRIAIVISVNYGFQCIHDLQAATTEVDFGNEFRQRAGVALAGEYLHLDLPGSEVWNEGIPPEVTEDGRGNMIYAGCVEPRDRVQRFYD